MRDGGAEERAGLIEVRLTPAEVSRLLIEAALMRMYEVKRENNALRQELRILKGEECRQGWVKQR